MFINDVPRFLAISDLPTYLARPFFWAILDPNIPQALYIYLLNIKTVRKIFFKFCVLLRKPELYNTLLV